jgi:hypothetical protein
MHESRTTFNFLGVPGRLIFHVIKIGRSARAGKATAMENGLTFCTAGSGEIWRLQNCYLVRLWGILNNSEYNKKLMFNTFTRNVFQHIF